MPFMGRKFDSDVCIFNQVNSFIAVTRHGKVILNYHQVYNKHEPKTQ